MLNEIFRNLYKKQQESRVHSWISEYGQSGPLLLSFSCFPINLEHTLGGNYPPVKLVNRIVQRSAQIRSLRSPLQWYASHPAIQSHSHSQRLSFNGAAEHQNKHPFGANSVPSSSPPPLSVCLSISSSWWLTASWSIHYTFVSITFCSSPLVCPEGVC